MKIRKGTVLLAGALWWGAGPLEAAVLEAIGSASHAVRVGTSLVEDAFTSVEDTTTDALDLQVQSGSHYGQSLTNLNVVFAAEPFVDVQASTAQVNDASTAGKTVTATATALLRFRVGVFFKKVPPFLSETYPIILRIPYALSDFGTEGALARVYLNVEHAEADVYFQEERNLGEDPAEDTFELHGPVVPYEPVEIWIEATVFTAAPDPEAVGVYVRSEAQAVMGATAFSIPPPGSALQSSAAAAETEPMLEFDQAAFDALHGEDRFVLSTYLSFVLSGNLNAEPDLVGFPAWQTQYFGSILHPDAGPGLDPDFDGLFNLIEYALGGLPLTPSTAVAPELSLSSAGDEFEFSFSRLVEAPDIAFLVETSDNHAGWNEMARLNPGDASWITAADVVEGTEDAGQLPTTLSGALELSSPRFFRLGIELEPSAPAAPPLP